MKRLQLSVSQNPKRQLGKAKLLSNTHVMSWVWFNKQEQDLFIAAIGLLKQIVVCQLLVFPVVSWCFIVCFLVFPGVFSDISGYFLVFPGVFLCISVSSMEGGKGGQGGLGGRLDRLLYQASRGFTQIQVANEDTLRYFKQLRTNRPTDRPTERPTSVVYRAAMAGKKYLCDMSHLLVTPMQWQWRLQ